MENFITVKREDGNIVTNPAERNIILLRYAAFLNENEGQQAINIHQIQSAPHQEITTQIIEQHQQQQHNQPQQSRKSSKNNAQAQGANMQQTQKLGG